MAVAVFHPLKVAAVEELTSDAVAVTFEVPDDLADEFVFVPGQSLTLRRTVDGVEQRRQYSISAPAPRCMAAVASPRARTSAPMPGFSEWAATNSLISVR